MRLPKRTCQLFAQVGGKIVPWVIFSHLMCSRRIGKQQTMKSGIEYMTFFSRLVTDNSKNGIKDSFQIGWRVFAGDFPYMCGGQCYTKIWSDQETPFGAIFCQI